MRCPSTYGHLQTIVDLVDEWPQHVSDSDNAPAEKLRLYWGHKLVDGKSGTSMKKAHAGTSTSCENIRKIQPEEEYGGMNCGGCFS